MAEWVKCGSFAHGSHMNPSSESGRTWYVLHTKPKQEERAARNLDAWRVETFIPRISARHPRRGTEILFPGYIFAFCDAEMLFHKLAFTRGIAHVVSFGGRPAPVSDDLILTIRARAGCHAGSEPVAFKRGDPVVIQSGMFRDLIGIFERETPDHERVQILLNTIAYSARIEFPRSEVSALKQAAIRNFV